MQELQLLKIWSVHCETETAADVSSRKAIFTMREVEPHKHIRTVTPNVSSLKQSQYYLDILGVIISDKVCYM